MTGPDCQAGPSNVLHLMNPQDFYEKCVSRLLGKPGVTRSTMMGYPCLRREGAFFACSEKGSGDLVVKLPAPRVQELIHHGTGLAFAPGGKPFREWVRIHGRDPFTWASLLEEAWAFASSGTGTGRRKNLD